MVREEKLDPDNWDELRALGHKMLDNMIDFHKDSVSRNIRSLGSPEAVARAHAYERFSGLQPGSWLRVFSESMI
jgi:hypothetical protein